jgi:hypothetical protein
MRLKGGDNFVVSSQLDWRRSSTCDSDTCAEIAIWDNMAYLRNSRDTDRYLVFDAKEWRSFLAGARDHEFDIG